MSSFYFLKTDRAGINSVVGRTKGSVNKAQKKASLEVKGLFGKRITNSSGWAHMDGLKWKQKKKKKTLSIFKRPSHVFLILEDHDLVRVTCENDDQAVMYSANTALVATKTPWSHRQSSGSNHYTNATTEKKKKVPRPKWQPRLGQQYATTHICCCNFIVFIFSWL